MTVSAIPPKIQKPLSCLWMIMIVLALVVAIGRLFFRQFARLVQLALNAAR